MAEFFRSSKVWVVDYLYEGRSRRWLKAVPSQADARAEMQRLLRDLYEDRAVLVEVREATEAEEADFRHGNLPRNVMCPTGR